MSSQDQSNDNLKFKMQNAKLEFKIKNFKLLTVIFNSKFLTLNSLSQNTGLTLVELLLVVAIITTITLMATPFYARFFTQNAVQATQDQLTSALRKAHIYSAMGKQNGGAWGVHYGSNTITLFQGNSYVTRNSALDETYSVNGNIAITGLPDIVFTHATGIPTPIGPTSITISGNNQNKTVIVNEQGIISKN